jgi:hypothetical protein
MNNPNRIDNATIDLAAASFNCVTPYSVELALTRGIVVEVTEWVAPDIGFGKGGYRLRVVLTARLWDTLLQAYVRRRNGVPEELGKRRNDVLWLAAQALDRTMRVGSGSSNFSMYLPLENEPECRTLRVERFERKVKEICQVTIGFPEDFARL